MKTVILAGGYGTRISEESDLKPKPMIEIGGMPIIWHIMKYYSHFGHNDFIVCCGYKGYILKEFFANYYLHRSDVTFDFSDNNKMVVHNNVAEPWKITLVDTGLNTMTGGRIRRIRKYTGDEAFMLTYGDGLADVDLRKLVDFHKKSGKTATITAIQPGVRFGIVEVDKSSGTASFTEKPKEEGGLVNGGFMVLEPGIFDYLESDATVFEKQALEKIGKENKLSAYRHNGFWQCMDTMRDKRYLEELVEKNKAPWMVW
jgi:glucose-1-phosphate cytidylyltransferase